MYFEGLYIKPMKAFTFLKVYIFEGLLIFEGLILEIYRKHNLF